MGRLLTAEEIRASGRPQATGTYRWINRVCVKVSEKPPVRGTPDIATKSFNEQIQHGYRRCLERGERINGRLSGIQRILERAQKHEFKKR